MVAKLFTPLHLLALLRTLHLPHCQLSMLLSQVAAVVVLGMDLAVVVLVVTEPVLHQYHQGHQMQSPYK
tara:strand:- start:635 stop:841 length:207 start_codon:yes stop_codon:yes gene_type:complete